MIFAGLRVWRGLDAGRVELVTLAVVSLSTANPGIRRNAGTRSTGTSPDSTPIPSSNTPSTAIHSNSPNSDPRPHRGHTRPLDPIWAPHPAHSLTCWTIFSSPGERESRTPLGPPRYITGPLRKLPATRPTTRNSTSAARITRMVYASAFSSGAFISTGSPKYSRNKL